MSDNIVSGNKFAFGDPLSASVGVNFNLTVTMPDAYALTGKWATLTVSKFEDGPELFKLSEAGGGLTFSGQSIPVVINNDATNETAGGDNWHTLIESYRNLRFSLDVGDDSDTSNAEYRFQGDITTDPRRGVLPSGLEIGETVTPTLGGTTVQVSLLGTGAPGPVGPSGADGADSTVPGPVGPSGADGVDGVDGADGADGSVNHNATTDIDGLVFGDGSNLSAATASQIKIAADLNTTNSPTFLGLTLTGNINLTDGAILEVGSGTGDLTIDADFVSIPNAKLSLGSSGKLQFSAASDQGNAYTLRKSGVRIYAHGNSNNDASYMYTASKFHFHSTMVLGWGSGSSASDSVDIGLSRGGSGHLKLGNGTQDDASGKLEVSDLIAGGNVDFSGLPTSDPAVAGRLWNDSGTLKISAG